MSKSFIIHKDSLSVLKKLSKEQKSDLFDAIYDYQLNDKLPEDNFISIVFEPFLNQFKRDQERYNNIIERNKSNGSKGGRPKNPMGYLETQENPREPKKAYNNSNSDSDSESDSKNNSNNLSLNQNLKSQSSSCARKDQEDEDFKNLKKGKKIIDSVDTLLNEIGEIGLDKAKKHLKEKGLDVYEIAKIYIAGIPTRGSPDNWTAGFIGYCKTISKKSY